MVYNGENLGAGYPPWSSVYYYFRIWKSNDTLKNINAALNQRTRIHQGKAATPSMVCIDSQSIKTAPFINEAKGIDGKWTQTSPFSRYSWVSLGSGSTPR